MTVGGSETGDLKSGFQCTAHGKWAHPIDSMRLFDAVDEGDMFLLDNGDVMEIGTMENPKSGEVELYKEYWTAPTPAPQTMKPSVVVKTEDGGLGIIVRIGDYCQGIYQSKDGEQFFVERWTRDVQAGHGNWTKDSRSNTGKDDSKCDLPIRWTFQDGRKSGDHTEVNGRTWKVTEFDDQ